MSPCRFKCFFWAWLTNLNNTEAWWITFMSLYHRILYELYAFNLANLTSRYKSCFRHISLSMRPFTKHCPTLGGKGGSTTG